MTNYKKTAIEKINRCIWPELLDYRKHLENLDEPENEQERLDLEKAYDLISTAIEGLE